MENLYIVINIHPTKMDIKFSKLDELLILIEKMIKNSLKTKTLIPEVSISNVQVKSEEKKEYNKNNAHMHNKTMKINSDT